MGQVKNYMADLDNWINELVIEPLFAV